MIELNDFNAIALPKGGVKDPVIRKLWEDIAEQHRRSYRPLYCPNETIGMGSLDGEALEELMPLLDGFEKQENHAIVNLGKITLRLAICAEKRLGTYEWTGRTSLRYWITNN